ncbi:alpha/beta hydrolase [Marinomonas sp. A79]|uniref:Alpha/beta hydrolase n=1 Tax=Marinomonas vulgaris TaxID=2823372 RepID=A0ABS5HCM7_9GAMM|nr:alpha/beta hydrolase [Marinomonas vulgaris]MBR7889143.1 alpha/beta hydrolase [Marinomonas vulgaris]
MSTPIGQHWTLVHQGDDLLGPEFHARTFAFAGAANQDPNTLVHTTLIHHKGNPSSDKGILYVHGYTDYFFQTGLAEHFVALGYRFYALDLQGYGRSIRPSTPPNWCDSLDQYGQDIDIALATMKADGINSLVLLGHSTGGLILSNYLAQPYALPERDSHYRNDFPTVRGLILNSPFLALPFPPAMLNRISWPIRMLVSALPFSFLRAKKISLYAKTLHTKFGGEWDYRLDWKPAEGFDLSFHWLREIIRTQRHLAHQRLAIPTLLCRSKVSTIGKATVAETQQGDGVLDVDSMQDAADKTFSKLTTKVITEGFHDLYLSHKSARQAYLSAITTWLNTLD